MQYSSLALAVLTAAATAPVLVAADGPTNTFNSSDLTSLNTSGTNFVDQTTRNAWCTSQRTACSILCGGGSSGSGGFSQNECDANALTWNCTCSKNNSAPGLQWYATSLPNNLCNTLNGDCMKAQAQNGQAAQMQCNSTYVCSNLNITTFGKSAAASSAASSKPTGSTSATGSGSTPSATKNAAAAALFVGEQLGSSVLGAGLVAALGYLL